jgi:hypothetical protein
MARPVGDMADQVLGLAADHRLRGGAGGDRGVVPDQHRLGRSRPLIPEPVDEIWHEDSEPGRFPPA